MPLADKYRPTSLDDMVGNQHLIGSNGILHKMIEDHSVQSMIFYGPPGIGKTTSAYILADAVNKPLAQLNAVDATVSDIKNLAKSAPDTGVVLYLDEIQYFNKKQQQSLLPYVEDGTITLIASTTENPYHDVYDALLSRCLVLEFKRPTVEDIQNRLSEVVEAEFGTIDAFRPEILKLIAQIASGDVRRALNHIEMLSQQFHDTQAITIDDLKNVLPSQVMAGFDMDGDSHYGFISCLQKSIRGSDADAAVFWLTKLLEGGDIISPCRRLLVIACEDIGLANPQAIEHTLACTEAAQRLGLPEAYKPLTQAVIYLAMCPKSNTNEPAYMAAQADIQAGRGTNIPPYMRTACAPGYKYPHDYPNHWVNQLYMPLDLAGRKYYTPGDNPTEQNAYNYWQNVRNGQA